MGLEDIAMIRSIRDSVVLYPSDGVSTDKLVDLLTDHYGIDYLRVTREPLPILYDPDSSFEIGGSHVLESSPQDQVTVIGAGITVHQALKAYDQLKKDNITVRVIDLYSVKPLDQATLEQAANQTSAILVVEDHYPGGGIGEAVAMALATSSTPIYSLAVIKMPRSGQPMELLAHQGIDSQGISNKVKQIITNQLH
jgi:transketolase